MIIEEISSRKGQHSPVIIIGGLIVGAILLIIAYKIIITGMEPIGAIFNSLAEWRACSRDNVDYLLCIKKVVLAIFGIY